MGDMDDVTLIVDGTERMGMAGNGKQNPGYNAEYKVTSSN